MKQTYAGHSTTWLSELLYCPGGSQTFSLIPLRPHLKPPGLATAGGADSAPRSAPEAPGQDGWRAKPQRCIHSPAAAPAQRPSRPQFAGQGPQYFPNLLYNTLQPLVSVHCGTPSSQPIPYHASLSFIRLCGLFGIAWLSCLFHPLGMGCVAHRTAHITLKL